MKIDLEGGRSYNGLGDIVMFAWLAEGCKDGPDPLIFHRTRNLDLMALLGLAVAPEPGGIRLEPAFEQEVRDQCRRPRVEYLRQFLNLTTPPVRPPLHVPPADQAWAAETVRELGRPPVLLFPQTAWRPREWPPSYWVDLAWMLTAAGLPVLVLLAGEDERYTNTPVYAWGTPFVRLAALMTRAALVVGGDSFPAHLAGTVGAPTLALLGPTRPTVFAHMPGVECMFSTAIDCTGCHFRPPFRAACDQGCQSLFRLYPADVCRHVVRKVLGKPG